MPYMQTLVYYCAGGPVLCVFCASTCEQCLGLGLCCLSSSLGAPGARLFYGPPLFCAIREWRTEPAFSVAGCICASSWFPPLLSWSSLGAHPVAGYAWRPPGVGERADGLMDGKGEGVGCFVRVYLFRNSSQACSRTYVYICIYIDIYTDVYICMYTDI